MGPTAPGSATAVPPAAAIFSAASRGGVGVGVVDHDRRAGGGQRFGVGPAQAAAGAGHDGHPTSEIHAHLPRLNGRGYGAGRYCT